MLLAASQALTDRIYVAPLVQSANWCNQSGFPVYFYVYGEMEEEVNWKIKPLPVIDIQSGQ